MSLDESVKVLQLKTLNLKYLKGASKNKSSNNTKIPAKNKLLSTRTPHV